MRFRLVNHPGALPRDFTLWEPKKRDIPIVEENTDSYIDWSVHRLLQVVLNHRACIVSVELIEIALLRREDAAKRPETQAPVFRAERPVAVERV